MVQPQNAYGKEDWTNFLRRVSFFSELEEDALKEVAKKLQPLSLPKGATLYRQGEPGDALYIVQSGRVQIVAESNGGAEKVLNYLSRGDAFGETALLTGAPRSVSAKVDSTANFLVLYKKDFESFLKTNASAAFYLSRLISQRLRLVAQSVLSPPPSPELVSFFCALDKEDRLVFLANMCLALTEQTRRKILLLDFSDCGSELVESMGLKPVLSSAAMFRPEDLRNPKILERFTLTHPSGLEIITLPLKTFSGNLFRVLPAFLATLKGIYDYVLIGLGGAENGQNSGALDEVSLSALRECDSVFHVSDGTERHGDALREVVEEGGLRWVILGKGALQSQSEADFVVPWGAAALSGLRKHGRAYLTGPESEPPYKVLSRIARAIGKLQVGLAMGSGAAYGYTLIGMLRVFEREKIPIDFVSGTSMGALIGAFYAAGKSAAELETIALSITKTWVRRNFLSDLNVPWPHGGILKGDTITKFLKSVLGEVEFKDLGIPFACAATDIMTGDPVILREGKVWEAVRCSLSLPFIFRPYKLGNRFLVDGGLVNPLPTSIIASMGADLLITVNLTGKVSERKVSLRRLGIFPSKSPGLFNIFFKMIYTMQYQIALARTDLSQIVILPETRNFSWVDFHRAKQIIPLGEEAAEESLTKIKSRLPFFADFCKVPIRSRLPLI